MFFYYLVTRVTLIEEVDGSEISEGYVLCAAGSKRAQNNECTPVEN